MSTCKTVITEIPLRAENRKYDESWKTELGVATTVWLLSYSFHGNERPCEINHCPRKILRCSIDKAWDETAYIYERCRWWYSTTRWKNDYCENIAMKSIGRPLWFMLPTISSIMSWKECANNNLSFCIWYSSGTHLMKHKRHIVIHFSWTFASCLSTFRRYAFTFDMDICKHVVLPRHAKTWHIRIQVAPWRNLSRLEVPTMGLYLHGLTLIPSSNHIHSKISCETTYPLSIPKLQPCHRWSLWVDTSFHRAH